MPCLSFHVGQSGQQDVVVRWHKLCQMKATGLYEIQTVPDALQIFLHGSKLSLELLGPQQESVRALRQGVDIHAEEGTRAR